MIYPTISQFPLIFPHMFKWGNQKAHLLPHNITSFSLRSVLWHSSPAQCPHETYLASIHPALSAASKSTHSNVYKHTGILVTSTQNRKEEGSVHAAGISFCLIFSHSYSFMPFGSWKMFSLSEFWRLICPLLFLPSPFSKSMGRWSKEKMSKDFKTWTSEPPIPWKQHCQQNLSYVRHRVNWELCH